MSLDLEIKKLNNMKLPSMKLKTCEINITMKYREIFDMYKNIIFEFMGYMKIF
jgi:hypothetical protein